MCGHRASAAPACPEAAAVTWSRCRAGGRPRLRPWHRRPLQAPSLNWCRRPSELSCAWAAGGQPVKGPCPPSPLGTPLIRRNVCVCAFYSFKGKKLSLCRILPGTPAAGCWLGSRAGGASVGDPALGSSRTRALGGPLIWEGLAGQGYREGWRVSPTQLQNPPLRLFLKFIYF